MLQQRFYCFLWFWSSDLMVVEELQQCCSSPSSLSTMELELNYEITRVTNYILTHNFSRVAFQVKKLLFFHFHTPICTILIHNSKSISNPSQLCNLFGYFLDLFILLFGWKVSGWTIEGCNQSSKRGKREGGKKGGGSRVVCYGGYNLWQLLCWWGWCFPYQCRFRYSFWPYVSQSVSIIIFIYLHFQRFLFVHSLVPYS